MSIKKWIDKQIVIYLHNGIPLKKEKKKGTMIHTSQNNYAEWKKPRQKKKEYILFDTIYIKPQNVN